MMTLQPLLLLTLLLVPNNLASLTPQSLTMGPLMTSPRKMSFRGRSPRSQEAMEPKVDPTMGCQSSETKGSMYTGQMNHTVTGLTCQMWSATEPHSHGKTDVGEHNYCRNPGGKREGVYCLTMDPNTRWQYCPVPSCHTTESGIT